MSEYLGLSILEIIKILMHEFWYYYIKPNYQNNAKLCYMGTDSFIIHIKIEEFYKDIANDDEKRLDTSTYEFDKKLIGLMKDELGGKIMTEFVAFIPKTHSYLMDDGTSDKKVKGT